MPETEADQVLPTPEDIVKKRIGRYDDYYDARTFARTLRRTDKPKTVTRASKYALVIRRVIDEKGRYSKTVIDIKSRPLLEVLKQINNGIEGVDLDRADAELSDSHLFHSYHGLLRHLEVEQAREVPNADLISDLKAAIRVVTDDQAHNLREFDAIMATKQVGWSSLPLLFKPNTIVYNFQSDVREDCLLIVREVDLGYMRKDFRRFAVVLCDVIRNDGTSFGYARKHFEIDEYKGVRGITDLDVYPVEFHASGESILSSAKRRGAEIARLEPHWFREYDGPGLRMRPLRPDETQNSDPGELKFNIPERFLATGRVMISPEGFAYCGPSSPFNPSVWRSVSAESMTDQELAICSPLLLGFSFAHKSWGSFAYSRLAPIGWNDEAFKSLVIDDEQKKMIHGLVWKHSDHSNHFDDIIKGKGRGLIGLLAGPPGCGKTLTAEAVAETTRQPLYQVTAGELGVDHETVEIRLLRVLGLAQMWNAVLLLDEAEAQPPPSPIPTIFRGTKGFSALFVPRKTTGIGLAAGCEVFLQKRSPSDLQRNAIVSIFLRQLEYYQGILILTTNLAQDCDPAFESRIHFSVYYQELDFAARKSIWSTFFRRASVNIDEEQLTRLAGHAINGRQIKNAFSSALTISLSQGHEQIRLEDIDVVLNVLQNWERAKRGHFASARPVLDFDNLL